MGTVVVDCEGGDKELQLTGAEGGRMGKTKVAMGELGGQGCLFAIFLIIVWQERGR